MHLKLSMCAPIRTHGTCYHSVGVLQQAVSGYGCQIDHLTYLASSVQLGSRLATLINDDFSGKLTGCGTLKCDSNKTVYFQGYEVLWTQSEHTYAIHFVSL